MPGASGGACLQVRSAAAERAGTCTCRRPAPQ